jgi:hypothetical protein
MAFTATDNPPLSGYGAALAPLRATEHKISERGGVFKAPIGTQISDSAAALCPMSCFISARNLSRRVCFFLPAYSAFEAPLTLHRSVPTPGTRQLLPNPEPKQGLFHPTFARFAGVLSRESSPRSNAVLPSRTEKDAGNSCEQEPDHQK